MFPALGLHCTKNGANDGAADADEGDHDDEPADGDGLGDGKTTAGLRLSLRCLHQTLLSAASRPETKSG